MFPVLCQRIWFVRTHGSMCWTNLALLALGRDESYRKRKRPRGCIPVYIPRWRMCHRVLGGLRVHSSRQPVFMGKQTLIFDSANTYPFQRFPLALQSALAAVSGAGMFMLPDTTRWYYVRSRLDEGDEILSRLYDRPILDANVQNMRDSILGSLRLETGETSKLNLLDLFWDRSNLRVGRRLRIAFLVLSVQQMMGESGNPS